MNDELFKTKDFYLAAYLLAKGFCLNHLNRDNPQKVLFVFNDKKNRHVIVEDFLFGRSQVEPKQFASSIRELKQLLYDND